jgi:diguanylate cyclase (GGDEF)-like protein/PAS domain S-box-containing protein
MSQSESIQESRSKKLDTLVGKIEWLRHHKSELNLLWFFLWVLSSASLLGLLERDPVSGIDMFWIANGLILTFLLLVPRNRWPAYFALAFAALFLGDAIAQVPWYMNCIYHSLDCIELYIIVTLLRPRNSTLPQFTSAKYALRFIAYATFLGPFIAALIYAVTAATFLGKNYLFELQDWLLHDGLGIAVTTPTCLAILRSHNRTHTPWKQRYFYMALLLAVGAIVFLINFPPGFLLIFPFLLLLLVNTEISWAALGILLVALIGGLLTLNGHGPLMIEGMTMRQRSIWLQIAVAAGMAMLYTVSLVIENLRKAESNLKKTAALHNLMMENSRDVVILASLTGIRSYVSPGVHALTGWEPADLIKKNFVELAHPQDRAELEMVIKALKAGSEGGTLEYRVRKRNGEYLWVEANLRVYTEPGSKIPAGILNLVRDITDRKRAEQQLQESYRAVEALAIVDAMTGAANRRRFDEFLHFEWRRRIRTGKPISLVMIDVDCFKLYNDTYGHVRGDSCLKQIAEAAFDVVSRSGDLVARYGGEEFAAILPDTDEAGAKIVAEEICKAVSRRRLKHEKNKEGIVTISLGYATMKPQRGEHAQILVEAADKALYHAKHTGKNRAVSANDVIPVRAPSTSATKEAEPRKQPEAA